MTGCEQIPQDVLMITEPLLSDSLDDETLPFHEFVTSTKFLTEATHVFRLGWPVILEEAGSFASVTLSMVALGRLLDPKMLSAVYLARSIAGLSGSAWIVGTTGPVDTFVSQVNGAGQTKLVGIVILKATLVAITLSLPVAVLWLSAKPYLSVVVRDPELGANAGIWLQFYTPWVVMHSVVVALIRALIAQNAVLPVMLVTIVPLLATLPVYAFFLSRVQNGLIASVVAANCVEVLYLLAVILVIALHQRNLGYFQGAFSLEIFKGWGRYLKLAAACTAMALLDFAIYDLSAILAGSLPGGNPATAVVAFGILLQLSSLIFQLPYGLSFAISARVGNLLGANLKKGARLAAYAGVLLTVFATAVLTAIVFVFNKRLIGLYTTDAAVVELCHSLQVPVMGTILGNGAAAACTGVLRSCGRQRKAAFLNFVANWLVGLPLELYLAFKLKMGASGLWWGLAISGLLQAGLLAGLLLRCDWTVEIKRAEKRFLSLLPQPKRGTHKSTTGSKTDLAKMSTEDIVDLTGDSSDEDDWISSSKRPKVSTIVVFPTYEFESTDEEAEEADAQPQTTIDPPFYLMKVYGDPPSEFSKGMFGAKLSKLVVGNISYAFISTFHLNLFWLIQTCSPTITQILQVVVIHGDGPESGDAMEKYVKESGLLRGKLKIFSPVPREQHSCHHSKYLLLQYDNGLRVIITTGNMVPYDLFYKTQMLYVQDFPHKQKLSPATSAFEEGLSEYIAHLPLGVEEKATILSIISAHDFSPARCALIASVPGKHEGDDLYRWGQLKLRRTLNRYNNFPSEFINAPIVLQASSLGNLDSKWLDEFVCSCSAGISSNGRRLGAPSELKFVWPTLEEARGSLEAYSAGGTGSSRRNNKGVLPLKECLKDYLCTWDGQHVGRSRALPHCKSYCRYKEGETKEIGWMAISSSNLSKAAWGFYTNNNLTLKVLNYELGAVFLPALELNYLKSRWRGFSVLTGTVQEPLSDSITQVKFFPWQRGQELPSFPSTFCVALPVPYSIAPTPYHGMHTPWDFRRIKIDQTLLNALEEEIQENEDGVWMID